MKVLLQTIAFAGIWLTCWSAFALEVVLTQPILNRWDKVEFKVTSKVKPLIQSLVLIDEMSAFSPPAILPASNDLPPPELPKNLVPREYYAVVSDSRVEVARPDNIHGFGTRRPRFYHGSGNAKVIYWRPVGIRT